MDTSKTPPKIVDLPSHLVDQIKAGEVVERPANVLKELLENSIDANPQQITIHLSGNGLDLISIEDDGHGMTKQQIPKAFRRHATSKIQKFEDLYHLHSFGFRGEALASISSVSKMSCHSRSEQYGHKLVLEGGKEISFEQVYREKVGTTMRVEQLFYNTPVRLGFIRNKAIEKKSLQRVVNSFLLTYPRVQFKVFLEDKDPEIWDSQIRPEVRMAKLFQVPKNSIETKNLKYGDFSLSFYLIQKVKKRAPVVGNFIFANDRLLEDKKIEQFINIRLKELHQGEFGYNFCVSISTPPEAIDVNVHPNKTQVKFKKQAELFSILSGMIKSFKKDDAQEKPKRTLEKEHQNSDLTLRDSPHHERHQIESFMGKTESDKDLEFEFCQRFENGISLIKKEGSYFLYDERTYHWLKFCSLAQKPISPDQIIPLLIAKQIKFETSLDDSQLKELEIRGWILEPAGDLYLLRSVPSHFKQTPPMGLLKYWIENQLSFDRPAPPIQNFGPFPPAEIPSDDELGKIAVKKLDENLMEQLNRG